MRPDPLYRKLIAGYDGSERAPDGLALAESLADITGSELLVVDVVPHEFPYAPGTQEREEELRARAQDTLADAVAESDRVHARVVPARSPAQGLHDLAESEQADAVVVSSSHRGALGRVLAGSVAERLLHGAPCPVAVAPAGYREKPSSMGVVACAFHGSDEARLALRHAEYLARCAGAVLRLLAVHEPELIFGVDQIPGGYDRVELGKAERKRLTKVLEEGAGSVAPGLDVEHEVLEGSAVEALAATAGGEDIDLLVVGSRGYGPVRRVLLGGVSSGLMRTSPVPVLAVPRAGD